MGLTHVIGLGSACAVHVLETAALRVESSVRRGRARGVAGRGPRRRHGRRARGHDGADPRRSRRRGHEGRAARRRPTAAGCRRSDPTGRRCASSRGAPARPASSSTAADDPRLAELLGGADVVIATPRWPGALGRRPVGAHRTRCGSSSPRSGPTAPRAHVEGERPRGDGLDGEHVLHGRPRPGAGALHRADGVVARRPRGGDGHADRPGLGPAPGGGRLGPGGGDDRLHGTRRPLPQTSMRGKRSGASIGITREIWPCADGFVSFGLRGGKARVANLQTITRLVDRGRPGHAGAHRAGLDDLRPQPRRAARSSTPSPPPSPRTSPATP